MQAKGRDYKLKRIQNMISMFAIPNCETVKKARKFLERNNIDYEFIDFKKCPPSAAQIAAWCDDSGELPVNKKGTTYRKYKDQYDIMDKSAKRDFIMANPSLLKGRNRHPALRFH